MKRKLVYKEKSYQITGAMFDVFNSLGFGHTENIYQRAIAQEFKARNIKFKEQLRAKLRYKGKEIGYYVLDFLVFDKIVIELKQKVFISKKDIDQLYRYLRATDLKLGLLISMTKEGVRVKRVVNLN